MFNIDIAFHLLDGEWNTGLESYGVIWFLFPNQKFIIRNFRSIIEIQNFLIAGVEKDLHPKINKNSLNINTNIYEYTMNSIRVMRKYYTKSRINSQKIEIKIEIKIGLRIELKIELEFKLKIEFNV